MAYDGEVHRHCHAMALAQPAKELGSRVLVGCTCTHQESSAFSRHSISSNWRPSYSSVERCMPSRGNVRDVHNGLIRSCIVLYMHRYETSPKIHKHIIKGSLDEKLPSYEVLKMRRE